MQKIAEATIVSTPDKSGKGTAIVSVTRRSVHPLYKKVLRRSKRYKVNSGEFSLNLGDKVKIVQTRPISKDKHFKIVEVIKK